VNGKEETEEKKERKEIKFKAGREPGRSLKEFFERTSEISEAIASWIYRHLLHFHPDVLVWSTVGFCID